MRQFGLHGICAPLAHDEAAIGQSTTGLPFNYRGTPIRLLRELDVQRGSCTDASPLVRCGVAARYLPCATPTLPDVPHRHYNRHRIYPHVSTMVQCDENEVARCVGRYKRAEVQTLFETLEREGLWQAVVRISRGIEVAGLRLTHLTQINVEASLRTLLRHAPQQLAVGYYFSYGEDMLLADDILVALFDACRHHERASTDLYNNLVPFQSRWTAATFACCLTITAHYMPDEAFRLYDRFRATRFSDDDKADSAASAARSTRCTLQHLFHVIVPLAMRHRPQQAAQYAQDMLRHDPEAVPDVYLKCLGTPVGLQLATDYVRQLRGVETGAAEAVMPRADLAEPSRCELAFALYRHKPSAMNMNSLLEILLHELRQSPDAATSIEGSDLARLLREIPMLSDVDAGILTRTLTERDAPLSLVDCFLTAMLARRFFAVAPALAMQAMRHGGYALAARAMTVYLSNQRGLLTEDDVELCVEASVRAGRWSSALFWLERARGRQVPRAASDSTTAGTSVVGAAAGGTADTSAPSQIAPRTVRTSTAANDVVSCLAALARNTSAPH